MSVIVSSASRAAFKGWQRADVNASAAANWIRGNHIRKLAHAAGCLGTMISRIKSLVLLMLILAELGSENAWCKMCDEEVVENTRHHMCQCLHDEYQRIRTAWYDKVKTKMGGSSLEMPVALKTLW